MSCLKNKVLGFLFWSLSFLMCSDALSWGNVHYYGGGGYYYGRGGYYGPGYYPGWGGPNVIINVPVIPVVPNPPYVIECERVEVCDNYTDECWIERRCN
jgi:hypothetical protein